MSGKHIESAVFDQALDAGLLMVSAIGQTSQIEISIRLLDRLNALQCEDASPCELAGVHRPAGGARGRSAW
jgi:hypothetical protein